MLSAFHPQSYRLTERINASMDQYLLVFINHQQDDCLKSLLLAEFAANNGVSEITKCAPLYAVQGGDPQMMLAGKPMKEWEKWRLNADQVQATMQ